ncbi:amino acid adenylation domain-containing protein [Shimazuella sp. AN120528]|uniref:non-ribosomal peptide synthetase n=1 Tax=Shimazuella soli TaxID=1892854 RepID=UPI001F0D4E44|nr:non-ribosomal peptide synthetase [Shimazuella soli]MCH5584989.1 amino acid adenylation domain-containing protein [Shimazuella soli]
MDKIFKTLIDIARYRSQYQGNRKAYTFLKDGNKDVVSYTYKTLDIRARAIAAWLQSKVQKGDRVMLLYHQGLDFISAFYACLYAGVIAVPGYPPEKQHRRTARLQAVVKDAGAKIALTTTDVLHQIDVEKSKDLVGLDMEWFPTDTLSDEWAESWKEANVDRDTVTYLQYSSGSTGDPKGIMVSHGNMLDNSAIICERLQHTEDDVSVSWLPIFHDLGLIGCVIQPMFAGFHAVSLSPYQYVENPYLWLKAIDRFRGTTTCCPNFGFDLCIRKITPAERASLDLSSWRVAVNCAEPVRHQTLEKFTEVFSPHGFRAEAHYPMYGMAETTLFITGAKWNEKPNYQSVSISDLNHGKVRLTDSKDSRMVVSCGSVGTGLTVKIVNPKTLTLCENNEIGEIWVKGSSVAHGYWNRPEKTKEDFSASINGDGPYLRTGDLGYFVGDELFIAGRYKDLIIIRGRNLYPQDLELTVESCSSFIRPGCGAAFSIDHENEEKLIIVQELRKNARELIDVSHLAHQIRQRLLEEHGVACFELVLIEENSVKKTSSGKIQRRACKEAYLADNLNAVHRLIEKNTSAVYVNEGEFDLQKWSLLTPSMQRVELQSDLVGLLGLQEIGTEWENEKLSFFGFDSIKILQFKFLSEQHWNVELPSIATLLSWTWDQFINCIHSQLLEYPNEFKTLNPTSITTNEIPLNRGQEALWYIYETYPQNAAYLMPMAIRFPKELDKYILSEAVHQLVGHYPILRSSIQQKEDGKLFFQVQETVSLDWTEKEAIVDFTSQLMEDAYKPFDLQQAPLFRTNLYKHLDGSYTVLFCFHHIICDLWSLDIFLSELRTCYLALEAGTKVVLHSNISIQMEKEPLTASPLTYWKEKLAGVLPVLSLPQKRSRGLNQSFQGRTIETKISSELVESIRTFAREYAVTVYQVLLAVYQLVLSRYSGQKEVIIGSPVTTRSSLTTCKQMNYMVNPIAIRGDLSNSPTFIQLLKQTVQHVQESFENGISFIDLVEHLTIHRDSSISSIFQAMLAFEQTVYVPETAAISLGAGNIKLKWGKRELTSVALPDPTSQFDLTLKIAEYEGGLLLHWQYDSFLFEESLMQQLAQSFIILLEQILRNPNQSIDSYSSISKETELQIIEAGLGEKVQAPVRTLNQAWMDQVRKTPEAIAVVDGLDHISYQQMKDDVSRFTHLLKARGIGSQHVVGIALRRKYPLLVAMMAVLQTGAAYVGLDPSYPEDRLIYMIQDSKASLVLIEPDMESKLKGFEAPILPVTRSVWQNFPKSDTKMNQDVHDLAYFIYTSGSTGKPKGVAIEHFQAMNLVHWAKSVFSASELAGVLFGTSICFDLSIFEVFVPLLSGGKVIIAENALSLPSLSAAHEVTLINTVPSAAKALVALGIPSSVTTINLAGEVLTRKLVDELYQIKTIRKVYNLYGPSECTTYSTYALVSREEKESPTIGKPISNTNVYILDSELQIAPNGTVGELCIGGAGVARGYIGQPEKTKEKFIDHSKYGKLYRTGDLVKFSPTQELIYIGRSDFQVKVRGYRIELGEIEAALCEYPMVKDAVVIVKEQKLIAYITKKQDRKELKLPSIKSYLENKLPSYMVPNHVVELSSFPLTLNGKIDQKLLPEPNENHNENKVMQPTNEIEMKLLTIWQKVLKKDDVAINDRFFELGGDSIMSLQVIAEAKRVGLQISPKHFFTHPTIGKMASVAGNKSKLSIDQSVVTGEVALTPVQEWFFYQNIPNYNNWNQSMILTLEKRVKASYLEQVLQKVIEHHDALRLRFRKEQNHWTCRNVEREKHSFFRVVEAKEASLTEIHRQSEQQLNITDGPLIHATFVQKKEEASKLILVVHHLAVDGVSWRILLDDINRLYRQLENGVPLAPPPKTTSYANWSKHLKLYSADSILTQKEKQQWLEIIRPSIDRFPVDYQDGVNTDTQVEEYIQVFTKEETQNLLEQSFTVKINELLLTALWKGYQQWSGKQILRLDVEGHGRDHQREDLDVSRTIGWFTSIFPVLFQGDATKDGIRIVQRQLQSIPNGGLGFGILRYLIRDEEIRNTETSPICFNYLGQFDQMIEKDGIFNHLSFYGPRKYQEVNRPYLIEINCYIQDGNLIVSWVYSRALYRANTISAFAAAFHEACMSFNQKDRKLKTGNNSKIKDSDLSKIFSKIQERKGR